MVIGIFGFGCVGQGLWNVLHETRGLRAEIRRICIRDPQKARPIEASYFTANPEDILDDPGIDVVVELIDDAEAAYRIVTAALERGKAVVSANKKMIARYLPELHALQRRTGTPFLYEGACCASIPIIRNLEEYYDNDLLTSVEGILNGTTNFILTRLFESNCSYEDALLHAQRSGFAESDPTLDVHGFDPAFKLCILVLHAFGVFVPPDAVFHHGITQLSTFDVEFARSRGYAIKLIARCFREGNRVAAYCLPRFVKADQRYAGVRDEYNAVTLESAFSERQVFVGKGAGGKPTGCAVLSDISALRYRYQYEYRKFEQNGCYFDAGDTELQVYVRYAHEGQVTAADFSEVQEHYVSQRGRYWVGRIRLEKLQAAAWVRDCGVSLVELPA